MVEELSIKKNALHMLDLIDPLRIRDHQNKFVDLRIWLEEISGNKSIRVLYNHDSNVETKNRRLWSSLSVLFLKQNTIFETCLLQSSTVRMPHLHPIKRSKSEKHASNSRTSHLQYFGKIIWYILGLKHYPRSANIM